MIKSFTEFPKKQNYEHKNEVVRINYFHQFEIERKSVPIERKERVEHVKSMVLKFSEDQDPKDEVLLKTKLFGSCETCNTSHLHYYVCHSCGAKTCEKCLKPILLNFTKENNQQIQHKPTLCPRCIHDCYIILNRSLWWIYNTKPPLVEQKRDIIARTTYKLNLIDFHMKQCLRWKPVKYVVNKKTGERSLITEDQIDKMKKEQEKLDQLKGKKSSKQPQIDRTFRRDKKVTGFKNKIDKTISLAIMDKEEQKRMEEIKEIEQKVLGNQLYIEEVMELDPERMDLYRVLKKCNEARKILASTNSIFNETAKAIKQLNKTILEHKIIFLIFQTFQNYFYQAYYSVLHNEKYLREKLNLDKLKPEN